MGTVSRYDGPSRTRSSNVPGTLAGLELVLEIVDGVSGALADGALVGGQHFHQGMVTEEEGGHHSQSWTWSWR